MQTSNRLFDDLAKVATGAFNTLMTAGRKSKPECGNGSSAWLPTSIS